MSDTERRSRTPLPLRFVIAVALVTLLAVPVVAVMAATPPVPARVQAPAIDQGIGGDAAVVPGTDDDEGSADLGAGIGRGGITVTAVSGSNVSLKTDDGWTRTVTVTADTKITKAGATIAVSDLKVGDKVGLRQKKNDDGSYTVTAITVRTPKAGGEVTATTSTSITVKSRGGETSTITVNGSTTYLFGKNAGTKADVTVGSRIAAQGTLSGSTFTATRVVVAPETAAGAVTAKTSTTITIKGRGDKTTTIHVTSATKYKVRGKDAATLTDIAVGDIVVATGKLRADGSLDASAVGAGKLKFDRTKLDDWLKSNKPKPTASP